MLWTIAVILAVLCFLGYVNSYTTGGLRNGKASAELRLRRKDGSLIPAFLSSTLFRQKRYEAELKAARAEAERRAAEAESANQAKSRFLSHMSHELRTPINGIMGMIHLADLKSIDPEVREYLGYVRQSAEHLLELVNDVLDLSKIEAGKVELHQESFDLPALLDSILDPFHLQAGQKGLVLKRDFKDLPRFVLGDPCRLRQVLFNLLSNAIKFTHTGEVEVSVRADLQSAESVRLDFSVRDSGIGIPLDKLERIFESFNQLGYSAHASYGGTGLGLAISRHLMELMGGRIWAESREGKGSTFYFFLPLKIAAVAEPVALVSELPAGRTDQSGLKILLAEDDAISRLFMRNILQHQGHAVEIAANGREALEMLAKEQFDLVVMDVCMPVMGGEEAVQAIRNGIIEGVDPKVRVIALTAHAFEGDKERFLKAGFEGYLSKPVNMVKLRELLEAGSKSQNTNHPVSM